MLPVLQRGRIVIGNRWYRDLRKGDIVIFKHKDIEKVKRITNIEDGRIEVTGDNHPVSTDSRAFGPVSRALVVAKVIWP